MKKTLLALTLGITLFACKEKLPTNVRQAVDTIAVYSRKLYTTDSLLMKINPNKLTIKEDSFFVLMRQQAKYSSIVDDSKNNLERILQFNPKYSDNDEVKNCAYKIFATENEVMDKIKEVGMKYMYIDLAKSDSTK